MNISLTNELEDYVSREVKTGHYKSASEVIRKALWKIASIRGSITAANRPQKGRSSLQTRTTLKKNAINSEKNIRRHSLKTDRDMTYSVYFTQPADTDLDEILEFIAQDSPENALNFIDQLQPRIINTLGGCPRIGAVAREAHFESFVSVI